MLESIGAVELKISRAVYVFREKGKEGTAGLIAIWSVYVDDGLLFGHPRDPRFQHIKKNVDSVFNIKHWKSLGPRPKKHLGMQWQTIEEGSVVSLCFHMDEYIDNLKAAGFEATGDSDRPLDAEELAQYRSLLAKARWPVNRVVPELAYGVSALAQLNTNKVGEVTVHHGTELRKLVKRLKVLKDRAAHACM